LRFHKKEGRRHIIRSLSGTSPRVLFLLEGKKIRKKGQKEEKKRILVQKGKKPGLEVPSAAGLSDFKTVEKMVHPP